MITATCGHEVASFDDEHQVVRKDWDRLGHRALSHEVVCLKCKHQYARGGDLLETEADQQAWLQGSDEFHGEGVA